MNYLRHEKKEKTLTLLMRFSNCHLRSSVQLLLIAESNQAMFSLNSSLQLNTDKVSVNVLCLSHSAPCCTTNNLRAQAKFTEPLVTA